jgi:hypothetical protein
MTILSRIKAHAKRLEPFEAVLLVLSVCDTGFGPMLIDASHRTCAIFLLDPPHVELDLIYVRPCPLDDAAQAIRSAHQAGTSS